MQSRKVEVVSYDPSWPELFKQEAERIQSVLKAHLKEINFIGSTSIPDMPAKPVIDMLLECENIDDIDDISHALYTLRYENVRRSIIPHRGFFSFRQDPSIRFHLHIFEMGDPQIKRHVNFRDYLIYHPEMAKAYAQLKINLAEEFTNDISQYVIGKTKLVHQIDAKAKTWSGRRQNFLAQNTGAAANKWSREKIVKAMEANLNVHMTHFAQYIDQVELVRVPGFTLVNSSLPDDTFNYVIDADFDEDVVKQKVTDVTEYFIAQQLPFSWWLSPNDKPLNLAHHLEEVGYQNTENNVAMYFDLDAWNGECVEIPDLKIVRALDKASLRDFALVLTNDKTAFETYYAWLAEVITEDDPIEHYVGYVDGKPVVRGLSCYYAGVVGLHWLSTAPDARKKGYGTAMQQFRLKRAKELGYHIAVLQASHAGFPLYHRLGYKECGAFQEFKV